MHARGSSVRSNYPRGFALLSRRWSTILNFVREHPLFNRLVPRASWGTVFDVGTRLRGAVPSKVEKRGFMPSVWPHAWTRECTFRWSLLLSQRRKRGGGDRDSDRVHPSRGRRLFTVIVRPIDTARAENYRPPRIIEEPSRFFIFWFQL